MSPTRKRKNESRFFPNTGNKACDTNNNNNNNNNIKLKLHIHACVVQEQKGLITSLSAWCTCAMYEGHKSLCGLVYCFICCTDNCLALC